MIKEVLKHLEDNEYIDRDIVAERTGLSRADTTHLLSGLVKTGTVVQHYRAEYLYKLKSKVTPWDLYLEPSKRQPKPRVEGRIKDPQKKISK